MINNKIKSSVVFLVVLTAVLAALQFIIDQGVALSPYSAYFKVNTIVRHETDPEIACFGSSVGEVGINAALIEKELGRAAYNFSIDGTRFMQYRGLIEEFNEYSANCKLVVLAEAFFALSEIDMLTKPDQYIAHISNRHVYNSLHDIQPDIAWKTRYVPFYKFIVAKHPYYKASALGYLSKFGRGQTLDPFRGYTPKFKTWQHDLDSLNGVLPPNNVSVDSATARMYRQTVRSLAAKGRKVLIVITPIHQGGFRLLPDIGRLRKALASMQGDGVYFKDYSRTELSQSKENFYNNSHLNNIGADRFTKKLTLAIDSLLKLPVGVQSTEN